MHIVHSTAAKQTNAKPPRALLIAHQRAHLKYSHNSCGVWSNRPSLPLHHYCQCPTPPNTPSYHKPCHTPTPTGTKKQTTSKQASLCNSNNIITAASHLAPSPIHPTNRPTLSPAQRKRTHFHTCAHHNRPTLPRCSRSSAQSTLYGQGVRGNVSSEACVDPPTPRSSRRSTRRPGDLPAFPAP
jgi:hypothetical protein